MEVLEHRTGGGGAVGGDLPLPGATLGLNSAVGAVASARDLTGPPGSDQEAPGRLGLHGGEEAGEEAGEAAGETAGALDLFRPGEAGEQRRERALAGVDTVRCQVKITTRRNLHLRIANHTARDVYVRLVGREGRVSAAGVVALKDAVHLSQLEAPPTEAELRDPGPVNAPAGDDLPPPATGARVSAETANGRPQASRAEVDGDEGKEEEEEEEEEESSSEALTISELVYSPCASMLPTPVEDGQGGVDLLFSSPAQSPAWLLRELHADPDIQARLEAERERDRAYERARLLAGRSRVGGALSSGLRLLSSNERVNACLLSAARFVVAVTAVLLVVVPTLLLLLESDIDVSFLREIRQTPEFEQFHYEYYCPLRRWALCKISVALEKLWSD